MEDNFTHKIPSVEKAVEPVKKFLVEHGPEKEYRTGPNDSSNTCMLRLDWELVYKDQEELDALLHGDRKHVMDLMFGAFVEDLSDLLVNGDFDNYSDALLKSFNGERKRGKEAVEILIPAAQYYQQVIPKKNSIEYTLYCRFGAKFE